MMEFQKLSGDELVARLLELESLEGLQAFLTACRKELEQLRLRCSDQDWNEFVDSESASQLRQAFSEDPYCARGLLKPRGYAGDAVLIDYIYGTCALPDETSPRGSRINKWMASESKAFEAVRHRRKLAAIYIDKAIAKDPAARILSIACGHLRELTLCHFDRAQWAGELIAVDQDAKSLAVVHQTYGDERIKAQRLRISSLLDETADLGKFDLIYSTGLTDYLDDSLVRALSSWCKRSLNVGGVSFLANFDQCEERGFMETVMEWPLIYRNQAKFGALVGAKCKTFSDHIGVVCYAEF